MLSISDVVADLTNFVYHLAHRNATDATVLMDFDELVGELFLELVKGWDHYKDRNDLTHEQLLAIIRRIMDNRISELLYKHFKTHRVVGVGAIPLSDLDWDGDGDDDNPSLHYTVTSATVLLTATASAEEVYDSYDRVERLRDGLSPSALHVLDEILAGNELVTMNVQLSVDRAYSVYKSPSVKMRAWHVADSLGMDEKDVESAFNEITKKYKEVCQT